MRLGFKMPFDGTLASGVGLSERWSTSRDLEAFELVVDGPCLLFA